MKRWRVLLVLSALGLGVVAVPVVQLAAQPAVDLAGRPEGTRFMVAFLDSIARNSDPVVDVYQNRARAQGMATLLTRPMNDTQGIRLRVRIANELLRGGLTGPAIKAYEYAYAEIKRRKIAVNASYFTMLHDMLGIAYLRLGTEPDSEELAPPPHTWLFPMWQAAIQQEPTGPQDGPRKSIHLYSANLQNKPDDLATRWLLNIAYMVLGEYPDKVPDRWLIPPAVFKSAYDIGHFADVAANAGVAVPAHAGGSVMEDLDGDGLLDIAASSRGLRDALRYFRNNGDGSFDERTKAAGLEGFWGGLNMNHADYDNDGDRDLLVLRGAWRGEAGLHPNSLLQNQGDGTFADVTRQAGVLALHPTHAAAWGDYDNDGWLDLYVGNESSPAPKPPHPCQLYQGDGDGTFSEVAAQAGVAHVGFVKGVGWGDYNNDGQLDLYVSALNGDNALYHNNGEGAGTRFRDVAAQAGVQGPYISFPTWFWDYDNDGWQDILVAGFDMAELGDMAALYLDRPFDAEHVHLYRNQGDGTFAEVADQAGLNRVVLTMGANYGDLDNDGYLDAYFGTGMPDLRALLPNRMMRNKGGETFQDVTTSGGFGSLQKGHGVSFGDIDHDGDQDIYHVLGAAFEGDVYPNALWENPGHGNGWLTLLMQGVQSNRDAIGARIRVRVKTATGDGRDIYATVGTGGSFGSSSLRQEIGLGDAVAVDYVEVKWPATGDVQRFSDLKAKRAYRLKEGQDLAVELDLARYDLSP
jgi:hypothetical protein